MANNKLLVTLEAKDKLTPTIKGASDAIKDMKNQVDKAGKSASALDDYEDKFKKIMNSAGSVEVKLKQLQRLASDMEFKGLSGTNLFTQVVSQAGAAKDAISDARTAISKFSDDNMKLTASIQGFSTLAAAGTTLAGVMGLVGVKSDEVAQAILKVQSALAILNGVQQIANNLNKDSALMQRIKQIRMEDAAAKEAGDSIGKLASERLRDVNALKGVTSSRSLNSKSVGIDTTVTGANTAAQGANTTAIVTNTSENNVNTTSVNRNSQAVNRQKVSTQGAKVSLEGMAEAQSGVIVASVEEAKLHAILSKQIRERTISQKQLNATLKEYAAITANGAFVGAAETAMKNVATGMNTASSTSALLALRWRQLKAGADTLSRALFGVKAATAGWIALAAGAVYLIYKLATAEDEYVKELNEEAKKLQEEIDKQKNMTAEQQKAKAVVENLKRAQEELNEVREREKSYISTAASTFGNLMSRYRNLSEEYSRLKNNHEKTTWIKNNKTAFQELGFAVNNVADAEKYFANNTSAVIEGFKLRAQAAAAAALAVQSYQKAMQLEQESQSTGMRGTIMTVEQANKLPEEMRKKLLKNTHQESNSGPLSATEMYQSQYTGGRGTHTVIDSYQVPLDASEDFLKKLAQHGFVAKKRSAEAKKAFDEGNRLMDESFKKQQEAAKKLGTPTTPTSATNTGSTTKTGKPDTLLDKMQKELTDLQNQRANIDVNTEGAQAKIDDLDKKIREKTKEIEDRKIKLGIGPAEGSLSNIQKQISEWEQQIRERRLPVGVTIDDAKKEIARLKKEEEEEAIRIGVYPKEGSLEYFRKKISEYEGYINSKNFPVGLTFEEADKQVKEWKKKQEEEEVRLGIKVVPEVGSVGEMQKKISDINTQLQNKNLSLPMRIELLTQQQDLQRQIAEKTQGTLTIPANIEPQMSTMKGDLFDLRQSRQNAQNAINQIVSDFESGIIKSREDAEKAINEINDKLEELGEKKIEVKIGAKGISKTVKGIESVASSAADAFSALAEASDTPELNVAGVIAGGIASVIQGYGTATAMAAQGLGPWGWIAFGLAATAQLVSMIAAIDQATAGAQGYAQGGIVTGASSHGDALGINVNAGEMVLTKQQQGKLWNTINDNRITPPTYDTPRIVGKIRGRDMVLMMQNEKKMSNKAGLSLNIS